MANLTDIVKDIEDISNNNRVHKVASVSALSTADLVADQSVELIGYHDGTTVGGGSGVIAIARHNGGTSISLTREFPTDWADQAQLTTWFADSGVDELCFIRTDYQNSARIFGSKDDENESFDLLELGSVSSKLFYEKETGILYSYLSEISGTVTDIESDSDGSRLVTVDGTVYRLVDVRKNKTLYFDNIAEMKSQPSEVFTKGARVHINDYYGGWAAVTTREPFAFSGVIVDDAEMLNIRGNAADGYGDHSLGGGLNFLVDTGGEYINRVYGCRPNSDVDDNLNIQAMFNAPKNGMDASFVFASGVQYISSSSQPTVSNLGKVEFRGDSGSLRYSGSDATKYGVYIQDCLSVKWNGLDFDIDSKVCSGAVRIIDIRYQVKIHNTNIKNFSSTDSAGFECAVQAGFVISDINKDPSTAANNSSAGLQVVNCSFGNEATDLDTNFDYNNNFCGGTGLKLLDNCEYWRVSNSAFFGNCVGIWSLDSANGTIVGCEFQEILGVLSKSDISTPYPSGGGVFVSPDGGGGNGGKLTIADCKFNHNWGFSIRSAYSSTNRPIHISGCQFIANSFIPINFATTRQCTVHNNHFERAHNYLSLASYPWASFVSTIDPCFIWLANGTYYTKITENHGDFLPDGVLVYISETTGEGLKQKIANNTVSSTVNNSINVFYNATPSITHDNYVLG